MRFIHPFNSLFALVGIFVIASVIVLTNELTVSNNYDSSVEEYSIAEKPPVKLAFFGDVMVNRGVEAIVRRENDESYPYHKLDGLIPDADVVAVNLEGTVGEEYQDPDKEYDFLFSTSSVLALMNEGITHVSLANNHSLDQGNEGLEITRDRLSQIGLPHFGTFTNDASAVYVERIADRFNIGFLGLNFSGMEMTEDSIIDLASSTVASSDYAIVMIHWGEEYVHLPNDFQQNVAHLLIDNGIDAIIGGHPHVMQGVEFYKTKPVFYSLGNFIFDQFFSDDTQEGYGVLIELREQSTPKFSLIPYRSEQAQPRPLSGPEKVIFKASIESWSESLSNISIDADMYVWEIPQVLDSTEEDLEEAPDLN